MTNNLFGMHAKFCATHPCEVIFVTLTLGVYLLTVDTQIQAPLYKPPMNEQYNAIDLITVTVIRCFILLYSYYKICQLRRLGSRYIFGIAGLFIIISSFTFVSALLNFQPPNDISDFKDAAFFFLVLINLSKATDLAEFALSASTQEEVKRKIANGMTKLGYEITLDTILGINLMGVVASSGFHRLERLSQFASLSAIVNYIVFMTCYPACLSLIIELSITNNYGSLISKALKEEDHKSNPIVQRIKLIMSAGLALFHLHSRLPFRKDILDDIANPRFGDQHTVSNNTEDLVLNYYIMKWMTSSADHIVILIVIISLIIKFVFFENNPRLTVLQENPLPVAVSQSGMPFYRSSSEFYLSDDNPKYTVDQGVQTDIVCIFDGSEQVRVRSSEVRSLEECVNIYNSDLGASALTDDEVMLLVKEKKVSAYQLEKVVNNPERGVEIRRKIMSATAEVNCGIENLPYKDYDYSKVMGACCENVIGYVPVPVGLVGPLKLDGKLIRVPMATTEGCLVASTNRGCRALLQNGVASCVVGDGMTRAPVVEFPSLLRASEAKRWMELPENFALIKAKFDATSRYARLKKLMIIITGKVLFIRFVADTGDAMGMNMLSKGTESSLNFVQQDYFPDMDIISLSGNFCTDKKPAAVNWIEGRGKSVVCEAIVSSTIISTVLKTTTRALVDLTTQKIFVGGAVAGSIGGFNAHSANVVTAIYIATGQDPAQNVCSSNCLTFLQAVGPNEDLYISCTMPSVEVGTVGGGTILPAQAACLDMLNVRGPNMEHPGNNAKQLAKVVCATVLAGELSLLSALAAGHLVKSHLKHNRSSTNMNVDIGTAQNLFVAPCKKYN